MLEREVKLGAGPAFHLPDLAGVIEGVTVAPAETVRMETVYFDTADLRLARWGVSLRHRAGEGWTLKLAPPKPDAGRPAGMIERDELTFQGGAKKAPEAAIGVVRAYVRKAELVPVARLSTIRKRVRLVDAAGARVSEGGADEVAVGADRRRRSRRRHRSHRQPPARRRGGRPRPHAQVHSRARPTRHRTAGGRAPATSAGGRCGGCHSRGAGRVRRGAAAPRSAGPHRPRPGGGPPGAGRHAQAAFQPADLRAAAGRGVDRAAALGARVAGGGPGGGGGPWGE